MSVKKFFSNNRGEAASLVIIVSMIIVTLGVLTGSRFIEQRVKTSSRASNDTKITSDSPPITPYPFTMSGYIRYSNGVGISDIVVKLYVYNGSTRTFKTQLTTDTNGFYTFNLPIGTYDVEPQSTTVHAIAPAMQTMTLLASPYQLTVPLFTASGSPTATPIVTPTNTPTSTPTPASVACVSMVRDTTANQLELVITAGNAPNPFYALLQRDGINILSAVSTNATTVRFPVSNPVAGKYKGFVSATLDGFYKGSPECEYIYDPSSTVTPTTTPVATYTPTVSPSATITATPSVLPTGTVAPTSTVVPTITLTPTQTLTVIPTSTTTSPVPSTTGTPNICAKKSIGDADCKQDATKRWITILDYAIWYSEFINQCSADNIAGCGTDADGDGNPMDANFNYAGTNYIVNDNRVTLFDYAIWIQGFITSK